MNSLSWFVYLAEVIPSIGNLLGFVSVAALIIGAILLIIFLIALGESHIRRDKVLVKGLTTGLICLFVFSFFFGILGILIPSKDTIYMIAGSEAGEMVVTSETGQEMISDIHEVIKHQLDRLKGDEDNGSE